MQWCVRSRWVVGLALSVITAVRPPAAPAQERPGALADSLLAAGRLQEAAWTLREAGDTARADSVLARLEAILRRAPLSVRPQVMDSQGVSYTWFLEHGDGVASIFKVEGSDIFCRLCGADREVAAYRLDRLLGFDLTPMTVFARIVSGDGDTLSGSAMYYVRNAARPGESGAAKPDRLHLFDAVIGNSDRHRGNWLGVDGRVVAIDHNRAFEYQPTTRPRTCWETEVDAIRDLDALGRPWARYRTLPPDSFRAALAGVDSTLVRQFLAMRSRVIARIETRIRDPGARQELTDCTSLGRDPTGES